MIKFIGIGDNVVDHYLYTDIAYPGGNALNAAVYALLLGNRSAYLGVFGDDRSAQIVQSAVNELGLDISRCRRVSGENGRAQVTLRGGDRVFVASNRGGVSKYHPLVFSQDELEYLDGFDVIHTGIYGYALGTLGGLHARGARLSMDFSEHFTADDLEKYCPLLWAAAFSCSKMKDDEIDGLIKKAVSLGVKTVIATRGDRGALVWAADRLYEQSPCLVKPKDTLGAGDAFITAFITRYVDGLRDARDFPPCEPARGTLRRGDYEDMLIKTALYRAAVFSAEVCMRDGSFGMGQKWSEDHAEA